jgi:threonine dehydrogenase-like Zn-dependent dehydrogenase
MSQRVQTARALWFEGPRRAALRGEEVPPPAPNEIQVRAIHSLVSAGSELNLYRGEGNLPDLLLPTARGTLPFPLKFAYQTVGEVVAAGAKSGLLGGEKVFATHPHQDLFNVPLGMFSVIPEEVDLLRAQFSAMFGVSLQVLLQRPVRPGEVVAVSGLGLIGSFAAYLARLSAGKLILIDPLSSRRDRASWIDADVVVSPEDAADAIRSLTEGRGVDLHIETSGAPAALQTAISNTAVLGTVAVAAWYGTRTVSLCLSPEFHLRSIKIISIHVFNLDEDNRWDAPRKFSTCLDFLKRIDVVRLITDRIPFNRAPDAYRLLDENPAERLAVLLEY